MAAIYLQDLPFHDGETKVRTAMHVPDHDNPTVPTLSPQLANHLQIAPLIAIGTLDKEKRPWTTLWGNGDKGFAQPMGQGIIGIRTPVTGKYDPVIEELVGKDATGEIIREEGNGRMVGGLTIDLEKRKRVKMYGRMVAGALGIKDDEVTGHKEHIAEIQLVLKIEQSLGNCPKYLNKKHIVPAMAKPELVSDSPVFPQRALEVIEKANLFFISTSQHDLDMDTNNRGGPPGFVRVQSNDESGAVVVYPEYSGNRLYQSLGNMAVNPRAGLCIPDFETGDMVYFTGTTEILVGKDAAAVLPRSNLAVKIKVTAARFVANALPFRGVEGDPSPYNPTVRYLSTEKQPTSTPDAVLQQATLLSQTKLTPTVSRFRFSLENAASYEPGQYVTLDLSSHLDMGYSHMRDEDPHSINDDFIRTFTVSSLPGTPPDPVKRLKDDQFEITIRKVGTVTDYLFRYLGKESRERGMHELEVGVKGFGGEFRVQKSEQPVAFIAAGVGITPILPSLWSLDYSKLRLLWTVRKIDIALVQDTLDQHAGLSECMTLFVTDAMYDDLEVQKLQLKRVTVHARRMREDDLLLEDVNKYYLCTPVPFRKQLMGWLPGKDLVFEDFNF
jgi:NAD(P)H-flavin reductase/predicted pyridoxine 5'-phosphate oxidase superfamily flavin-nucleotide-binding protein